MRHSAFARTRHSAFVRIRHCACVIIRHSAFVRIRHCAFVQIRHSDCVSKISMPLRSGSPLFDKHHQLYEVFLKVPLRLYQYLHALERRTDSAEWSERAIVVRRWCPRHLSGDQPGTLPLDRRNPYSSKLCGEIFWLIHIHAQTG